MRCPIFKTRLGPRKSQSRAWLHGREPWEFAGLEVLRWAKPQRKPFRPTFPTIFPPSTFKSPPKPQPLHHHHDPSLTHPTTDWSSLTKINLFHEPLQAVRLNRSASKEEIKQAFHKLAMECHPNKHSHSPKSFIKCGGRLIKWQPWDQ